MKRVGGRRWLALRPCRETGVGMGQGYRLEKSSLCSSQSPSISRLRTPNLQVTRWDMEKGMYVTIQQGTVNVELQAHRQALGHRLFWFFMPRIGTRALCMLGKHSTVEVFHEPVYLLVFVACMCVLLRQGLAMLHKLTSDSCAQAIPVIAGTTGACYYTWQSWV